MAKAMAISPSSVRRIWARHGLQPHRVRSFKLSNDPKFAAKLKEVVGLYIDPQLAGAVQLGQHSCVAAIGLDPISRLGWDQRRRHDKAVMSASGQQSVQP
jgi:hypothetical protein